jgi:N-acetylglucosamine kinase-like BadF-type ATPase
MTEFVLGIDAGGTSVRVAVALSDGATILSEVRGTAAADGGPEPLPSLIREAVREAARGTDDLHGLCAGITKISRTGVKERWEEMLRNVLPHLTPEQYRIVPDYEIAFHGAIPGGVGIAAR